VHILVLFECLTHAWIATQCSDNTQFNLRVICADECMIFIPRNECFSDLLPQFRANRNVLQVRLGRTQPTRHSDRLAKDTVYAPVGVHHLRQGIGVSRSQFVELAVIDDHLRDICGLELPGICFARAVAAEFSIDAAGANIAHFDVVLTHFLHQRLCETIETEFGCIIGRHLRVRILTRER